VIETGKFFLGKPYRTSTLESERSERLVINLREFDCFTFVENVVVLTRSLIARQKSFEAFQRVLKKTRYRHGQLQGYASRLHYFTSAPLVENAHLALLLLLLVAALQLLLALAARSQVLAALAVGLVMALLITRNVTRSLSRIFKGLKTFSTAGSKSLPARSSMSPRIFSET
jgi:hypothetical protein